MKRLLVLLLSFFFLAAQAQQQDVIGKKARKKTTKTVKPEKANYTSPNGGMVVHDISEKEILDSTQKSKITAPHVNSNFNETQPALSPSDGKGGN
jgi:hypothetical protein